MAGSDATDDPPVGWVSSAAPGYDPPPPAWMPTPSPAPTVAVVTDDALRIITDLETSVSGPVLTGHALTFVIDGGLLAGLVPAWLALPPTMALGLSIAGLVISLAGRAYAWRSSVSKAQRQHQIAAAPVRAARTVAATVGRHSRP